MLKLDSNIWFDNHHAYFYTWLRRFHFQMIFWDNYYNRPENQTTNDQTNSKKKESSKINDALKQPLTKMMTASDMVYNTINFIREGFL